MGFNLLVQTAALQTSRTNLHEWFKVIRATADQQWRPHGFQTFRPRHPVDEPFVFQVMGVCLDARQLFLLVKFDNTSPFKKK